MVYLYSLCLSVYVFFYMYLYVLLPIDKVSFNLPEFEQRWKFIYHRRVAVERELNEGTVKIKEVMELTKEAGLIKNVCNLRECYEKLVKEFVVNIPEDCDNTLSREY
jgi:hypothetical protein